MKKLEKEIIDIKPPVEKSIRIISLEKGHCLISRNTTTTSGGGASMLYQNSYDKIPKIHDAVTFARLWLTGDFNALPPVEEAKREDLPSIRDKGRQLTIRSARNGYIVRVANNNGSGCGWVEQFGDEVISYELVDALKFCGEYLEGKPGTNWYDWSEK